ncbi:oligosaccharide flippase family protein [uncultured Traorella sp.]|uniref:lipopolysaccharide biosynthesis protein n=1 Tax=uncultured Traorella sp. TaxID=1929048 RepID=UPI0025E57A3C|nr:oligosaccharide flippase family protein [uncultured Traorella sp.]
MSKRESSLMKNTAILSFGTLCTKGIMFFITPLIARWLSSSDFGTYDLILSYISLLVPIVTLSSGEAIFRYLLDEEDDLSKKTIFSSTFFIDFIGIIITLIACFILYIIFPDNVVVISSVGLYLITEILFNLCMMSLRGFKQLNTYTLSNIVFVIAMSVSVIIFVYILQYGLAGIFLSYACGDIISIILMALKAKLFSYFAIKSISKTCVKSLLRYSLPMIPNSVSWWIVGVSDRSIISFFLGTSANAVYAVSNKVPNLAQTLFNVFHYSWQQNATESMNDDDRDLYYSKIMNNMVHIVVSICLVMIGINYWFFDFLFSEEYFNGYYQVPILVTAIIFSMLSQFIGGIYVARKESDKNGKTTVIAAVTNIVVHIALVHQIGLYAASISTAVAYITLFIIRFIDIRQHYKLKFNKDTLVYSLVYLYFFITSYLNNIFFHVFNLIFGCVIFLYVNKVIIHKVLSKTISIIK